MSILNIKPPVIEPTLEEVRSAIQHLADRYGIQVPASPEEAHSWTQPTQHPDLTPGAIVSEEPPIGTELVDRAGDQWVRDEDGWRLVGDTSPARTWTNVSHWGPLRAAPDVDPDEAMARVIFGDAYGSHEGLRLAQLDVARAAREHIEAEDAVNHPIGCGQMIREVRDGNVISTMIDGVLITQCDPYGRTVTERSALARAEKAEADRIRLAHAVISVCSDTDGNWLDGDAEIPVGEVLRMVTESGLALHPRHAGLAAGHYEGNDRG